MTPDALVERLHAHGFYVKSTPDGFVAPCPCCQYWLTDRPHPDPPPDRDGADEEPCFHFKLNPVSAARHATSWCTSGCPRHYVYGLLGVGVYAKRYVNTPCRTTTYCLDLNRERISEKVKDEVVDYPRRRRRRPNGYEDVW